MPGALAHLWRGVAGLVAWTLRLVRPPQSRSSLPSAVPSSSSSSWGAWKGFLTSGPRRARRQSHAALELLEKFRQGPETQSEWNLFLWRATFPLVSLVLLTLLCVVGQFGHAAYSLMVTPVWYLCNLTLVTTPFLMVFRFSGLEEGASEPTTMIWRGLTAVSLAISLVEWYMSLPNSRYSWIVGNTMFGIVALGAVPLFFSVQLRTARSQYEDLVLEQEQDAKMHGVPEEDVMQVDAVLASPRGLSLGPRQRSGGTRVEDGPRQQRNKQVVQGQPATRLLYGCGFCALTLWLIMFSSYSSARGTEASTRSWFLLYLLSPILCVVLFCARIALVRFSFEHAVAYSTLVVHVPLFLGHLCVRLFALAEDPAASSSTSSESWLKLAISVLYLLLMQGYFFVITHMVNSMSEPFAHPSLLYVGQLYYYVFWYILVGSDTPIDALYWGMLLLNNIHIAFLNTGVYTDFKRSSSAWLAMPLHANITSSVAFCLRSTISARCLSHRSSLGKQGLLGLNCGVAGAAAMETDSDLLEDGDHDCEFDGGYGSDGFIVTRNIDGKDSSIGDVPSWQETGSRNRERDRSTIGMRRDDQTSALDISSPSRKTASRKPSSLRDKCSRVQMSCRKCGAQTSGSTRPSSGNVAPATSTSSRTATSDALRPLYFLMKLAEQDNMADTTALILVPSLLTLFAVFEKPGSALAVLQDQTNLWLRCICMFIGRLGGAFLAREIFTCKLRSRLRSSPDDLGETTQPDAITGSIDGMPARLWIQRLMLQDFHAQFWYLTAVTMVVTFGCFARVDLPLRFALLS